jgi:hypothetical protein
MSDRPDQLHWRGHAALELTNGVLSVTFLPKG